MKLRQRLGANVLLAPAIPALNFRGTHPSTHWCSRVKRSPMPALAHGGWVQFLTPHPSDLGAALLLFDDEIFHGGPTEENHQDQ